MITSAIRYEGENGRGYYIEDGGYPNFVSWLMEGTNAPRRRTPRGRVRRPQSRATPSGIGRSRT